MLITELTELNLTCILCRYTCEFNITQYGDDEVDEAGQAEEAVKDIFNLELITELESQVGV